MRYVIFGGLIPFLLCCVSCGERTMTYYIEKFKNNETEFNFYIKSRWDFIEAYPRGYEYTAVHTNRNELWQTCQSYTDDPRQQCNSDFIKKEDIEKAKEFMERTNLHAMIFYRDSVLFVFNGAGRTMIVFDSTRMKLNEDGISYPFYLNYRDK